MCFGAIFGPYSQRLLATFVVCKSETHFAVFLTHRHFDHHITDPGLNVLSVHTLAPWIFDSNQSPEISEKKQQKQERRLKRMQNVRR